MTQEPKSELIKGVDYIGVGVGAIIFTDEGKFFIDKRGRGSRNERGKWEFPGGSVEFGETLVDAIKREIREEFDFEIEILEQLITEDHIIEDEGQHWISPTFVAKYISGEPKIMEPDKCDGFKWVSLSELEKEELTLISAADLKSYLKKYGKNL